jgi:hypothetical protein
MSERYEIKIPISESNFSVYKTWFLQLKGLSTLYNARIINSIYFDCLDNSSARDNISGLFRRSKYRIRWYGNSTDSECFAEIKIKNGRIGKKIVLPTHTKFDDLKIEDAFLVNNSWFKNPGDTSIIPLIASKILLPILYVKYQRFYYLFEGSIRLTFDLSPLFRSFYNKGTKSSWKTDNLNVLEIKFNSENLSKAKNFISKSPFVPRKHSKYLRGLALCNKAIYL